MMNATVARELTNKAIEAKVTAHKEKLMAIIEDLVKPAIEKACSNGKSWAFVYTADYNDRVVYDICSILDREMGYTVTWERDKDVCAGISIFW